MQIKKDTQKRCFSSGNLGFIKKKVEVLHVQLWLVLKGKTSSYITPAGMSDHKASVLLSQCSFMMGKNNTNLAKYRLLRERCIAIIVADLDTL